MNKSKRLIISKSRQWLPLSRKKGDGVKEGHLSILKTWQCFISHCGGDLYLLCVVILNTHLKKKKNSHLYVWLSSSINLSFKRYDKKRINIDWVQFHTHEERAAVGAVWQPWGACCLLIALAGDALCGAESLLLRNGSWYPPRSFTSSAKCSLLVS